MTKPQMRDNLIKLGFALATLTVDYLTTTEARDYLALHSEYISYKRSKFVGRMNPGDIRLSLQEARAVAFYNDGKSGVEIAARLKVTVGTVKCHLSSARKKLGIIKGGEKA